MHSAAPEPQRSEHLPALDGVRGLAILTILIYHGLQLSKPEALGAFDAAVDRVARSGWAGVDLFFVLSGFLITGILLDMRASSGHVLSFYGRRVLRIVPLYFLFLLALLYLIPVLTGLGADPDVATLREHQGWYWSFLFNLKFALEPLDSLGRFGNGHLWSLMVEEQFYIVWPLVVLTLPRRALLPVLAACIAGAPLFRMLLYFGEVGHVVPAAGAYVLAPSRMDTLALGGLLALGLREPALGARIESMRWVAVGIALAAIVVLGAVYGTIWAGDQWTQIVGFSAIAVVGAGVVSAALAGGAAGRLLSTPGLRFFGRYSYAMYLFHYQVMTEMARRWDAPSMSGTTLPARLAFTALAVGLTGLLALASWYLIESRFLGLKRYLPYATRQRERGPMRATTG